MAVYRFHRHTRAPSIAGVDDFFRSPDENGILLAEQLNKQLDESGFVPVKVISSTAERAWRTAMIATDRASHDVVRAEYLYPAVVDSLTARYEEIYGAIGNGSIDQYRAVSKDNAVLQIGDRAWGMCMPLVMGGNALIVSHGNMSTAMAASICYGRADLFNKLRTIVLGECEGVSVETDDFGKAVSVTHHTMA